MVNNSTWSSGGGTACNNSSFCWGQNTNGTNSWGMLPFGEFFWSFLSMSMDEVMHQCRILGNSTVWLSIKIFILFTGLPANLGLLWMLMSSKKALSASEVLVLNLSILDILYCLCLPVDIYTAMHHDTSKQMLSAARALSAFNIFGCPLLLACMCVEHYLVAARPVAYMRLGKWKYHVGVCALVWLLTLVVMLLAYFQGVFSIALYFAVTISVLFLIMLLCLVGIMWSMCQSGTGEGSGERSGGSMNLLRRSLKNILLILVPSAVAYTPLVALVPFMSVWHPEKEDQVANRIHCCILQLLLAVPNFGLYIGPLFYMSRFRQLLPCCRKGDNKVLADSKAQAE
uniref:P2Y purinoceptor 8-like n=1 Tax=Oncorhynchus gorbuscha TaxID=8017 RepID=UPI001EAF1D2A|nr:P2Y purinoceptor 8-like [Oncorhynchus gorbuscha]XP_046194672.1 P2Y purinoceptor 8-like [Oncorhynchus gorbuscha]